MNISIINFTKPETGNFLVDIILWLVTISSSIAVGIVLFTFILKLVTLPFDFFSRASMRKNSLKMEEMRPELEKLQKQYAGDKALYNQKMMALYKKNGYSMFGACLPTILTLVIFIVAINAFTNYSQFQNIKYFYDMSCAYNNVAYAGFEIDDNYIIRGTEGILIVNDEELRKLDTANDGQYTAIEVKEKDFDIFVKVDFEENNETKIKTHFLEMYTTNGYSIYRRNFSVDETGISWTNIYSYKVREEKLKGENALKSAENNNLLNEAGDNFDQARVKNKDLTASQFILDIQQTMAAKKFHEENASFLWVKNIWVTDSPMASPVEANWQTFKTTHEYIGNDIGQADYDNLTAKLADMKETSNGYFILVILTAGISLLMQLVMGKAQKAQMELQTVDGQGAQTQKIMMWMMPIMMAIFAFMYTAAFSIYIILSSIMSIGTTFGINFIVDRKFKKEKKEVEQKTKTIRGRVYVPKEEPAPAPQKKKKDKKEEVTQDFLSGLADKKKGKRK